jgi:hypothetical protein
MSKSVLEKDKSNIERPYSLKELETLHLDFLKKLHIGKTYAYHRDCDHSYLCRAGGKKEKEIIESQGKNSGNCSVCWKLRKTPQNLQNSASDLVYYYINCTRNSPSCFNPPRTYFDFELETDFYTWLYSEFNDVRKET